MAARARRGAAVAAVLLLSAACASAPLQPIEGRRYDLARDSFTFVNEVIWTLPTLAPVEAAATPATDYHHRCFVVARSARQFFLHARFDAQSPRVSEVAYRELVRQVVARDPRGDLADGPPVVIPGYADLRAFSADREPLLKEEMGSALDSYFQVGNWRLLLPFTRSHQTRVAGQVLRMLQAGRPAIVHVVRFPIIAINHVLLVYEATETSTGVRFTAYDPNDSGAPLVFAYDRDTRAFLYPATNYFWGGPVNVYEIYRRGLF